MGQSASLDGNIADMGRSRRHRLRTWFFLSLLWVVLVYVMAVILQLGPLALIPLGVAAWFFVVWTVAVGVRVGVRAGG